MSNNSDTAVLKRGRGRPRRHSADVAAEVRRHAAEGHTVRTIAFLTGLPKSTVQNLKVARGNDVKN